MYHLSLFLAGQDVYFCAKNAANLDASGQGCWSEEGVGHSQWGPSWLCDPRTNQGGRGTRDQGAFFTFSALLEMEGGVLRACVPRLIPRLCLCNSQRLSVTRPLPAHYWPDAGNSGDQASRSELSVSGVRHSHRAWHGAKHGDCREGGHVVLENRCLCESGQEY